MLSSSSVILSASCITAKSVATIRSAIFVCFKKTAKTHWSMVRVRLCSDYFDSFHYEMFQNCFRQCSGTFRTVNGAACNPQSQVPSLDQSGPVQTSPDQSRAVQTNEDQSRSVQTSPDQSRPVQTSPDQSSPVQSRPVQTSQDQSRPVQTSADQSRPDQTSPDQPRPVQSRPV